MVMVTCNLPVVRTLGCLSPPLMLVVPCPFQRGRKQVGKPGTVRLTEAKQAVTTHFSDYEEMDMDEELGPKKVTHVDLVTPPPGAAGEEGDDEGDGGAVQQLSQRRSPILPLGNL